MAVARISVAKIVLPIVSYILELVSKGSVLRPVTISVSNNLLLDAMVSDGIKLVVMVSKGFRFVVMASDSVKLVVIGSEGFKLVVMVSDGFRLVVIVSNGLKLVARISDDCIAALCMLESLESELFRLA